MLALAAMAALFGSCHAVTSELTTGECKAATTRYTRGLDECINLSPPSTGTRTLTSLMQLYSPYAHHDHRITAEHVQGSNFATEPRTVAPSHWLAPFRRDPPLPPLEPPKCFVVTLRDPAARVHSSINNCRKGQNCFKKNLHWCVEFPWWNRTADDILSAYFDEDDPGHSIINDRTCWGLDLSTAKRYLGGVDCAKSEIHYLCTDRILDDFTALVRRLGENETKLQELEASEINLHKSGTIEKRRRTTESYYDKLIPFYQSQLDSANVERVRGELFPEDAALYEAYCGALAPPRES